MAPHVSFKEGLAARLPALRGRINSNAPLAGLTRFNVGGPAEILFSPADAEDLAALIKHLPADVPLTFLGIGSNLLIRDGGVPGIVVKLGPSFGRVAIEGEKVRAGCAAVDLNVARAAQKAGLSGLEFLSGIPGSLGGAIRMNAGAYGSDISRILETATLIDEKGDLKTVPASALGLSYRACAAPSDWIFVEAVLRGAKDDPDAIAARMKDIQTKRDATQPIHEKTAGSTFANPEGHKAWRLIEEAGCRGLRIGGAIMSQQHCNFMINSGSASAEDLESLGEEVRKRVREKSGLELRWEIRIIGIKEKEARHDP